MIIVAILQWGDKWNPVAAGAPLLPINRKTDAAIAPIRVVDINGESIGVHDLGLRPGPGCDDVIRERLEYFVTRIGLEKQQVAHLPPDTGSIELLPLGKTANA